jgi:glycosyltransferase involved in cell wall biosynthesis
MRLVIDGQRLTSERTGVGRCLESLLHEWAVSGMPLAETLIVLRDSQGRERVPKVDGLTAKVVGEGWPGLAWECFGLRRQLRPDDLLFAPANLVPPNWRGRTVLVIYDTLPWSVPQSFTWRTRIRFGWRYRWAARRADRVIVPSKATARDVARVHGIAPDRLRVIYPGPDAAFRPLPHDSAPVRAARRVLGLGDALFFLFVGKRSPRRNVPAILDAFSRHRQQQPSHRLVFVGPDDQEPLPGPEAGVIRAGHVAEPTLHGLMADAVALLYPSDYEGFGLPVVEAMASGCPVVTLRNSALIEAGGDAPWYLDTPSTEALLQALAILSSDPAERAERTAKGLAHVARFRQAHFATGVRDVLIAEAEGTADPGVLAPHPWMTGVAAQPSRQPTGPWNPLSHYPNSKV